MFRKFLPAFVAVVFFVSCDKPEKPKSLVYTNDAEQSVGWSNQVTLKQVQGAHSGGWVSCTDSSLAYSLTLREKISVLRKSEVSKVAVKAWVKFASMSAKGGMIVSVDDNGKSLMWEILPLESVVRKAGEWTEVNFNVLLKKDLPESAVVSVYMWNTSKEEILMDDMEVKFNE